MVTTTLNNEAIFAGTTKSVTASDPNLKEISTLSIFKAIEVKIESTKNFEPIFKRSKDFSLEKRNLSRVKFSLLSLKNTTVAIINIIRGRISKNN